MQEIEGIEQIKLEIEKKIHKFVDEYCTYPEYIKISKIHGDILQADITKNINGMIFKPVQYKHLFLCNSCTITKIEEIEVF